MKCRINRKVTEIPPEPTLLTTAQLAAFLQVSERTLLTFRQSGMPTEINRKQLIRFDRRKCLEWIQKNC